MAPRLAVLLASFALLAAGCGGGDGDGDGGDGGGKRGGPGQTERAEGGQAPRDTNAVTGGTTSIRLNSSITRVLRSAGVRLTPSGEAEAAGPELRFPITGGTLDPDGPSGVVEHAGGLQLEGAGRTVEARALQVDAGAGRVTAEVGGRRMPLFAFEATSPRTPVEGGVVVLQGNLRTTARSILEERLRVRLPEGLPPVGRMVVSANRPEKPGG